MTESAIGNQIKEMRKERKLTQQELADKIGVSLMTVLRWEKGERTPNTALLSKLSEVLNVSASYLMGEDNPPPAGLPVRETHDESANMAVMTLENGKRIEAPATPEGYAFLEKLFLLSMGKSPAVNA